VLQRSGGAPSRSADRADDIQGTAAVSLACFISAIERSGVDVRAHRFVFFGAGSAAIGIAQLMCEHLVKAGLSEEDARERFWLVDSKVRRRVLGRADSAGPRRRQPRG
jgi:malic enzyme